MRGRPPSARPGAGENVSSFADSSVITCALALGVGACGPGERPDDPFASGSASLSETGVGETGGPGGTNGGTSQSGPDSGPDAESGSTEAFKFDLGDESDIAGVTDGMSGEGCKYLDMLFVVDISG